MHRLAPLLLLLLAGCDSREACEDRGGSWEGRVVPGGGGGSYCNERAADAGEPCTDLGQCIGACEAPAGAREGDEVTGRCCEHERCFPGMIVVKGRARPGGIP